MVAGFRGQINADMWSKRLNMPYYKRRPVKFFFERTNIKLSKTPRKQIDGFVLNLANNRRLVLRLRPFFTHFKDPKRRHNTICFYLAIMKFFLPKIKDQLIFKEFDEVPTQTKTRACCDNLVFPDWAKEELKEMWEIDYTFEDFILDAYKIPTTFFDLQSALDTYHLQGEAGMYNVLVQMFTTHPKDLREHIRIFPDLPILRKPEISHYVSGCTFPVSVSPMFNRIDWVRTNKGVFLVNERGEAVDCGWIGESDLIYETLDNRLKFLAHYHDGCVPHVTCYNWLDVVEAVGMFQGDVLVRPMSEDLLHGCWNKFGPGGLFVAYLKGDVCAIGKRRNWRAIIIPGADFGKNYQLGAISLDQKQYTFNIGNEKRVWRITEMEDWFELGRLCVDAIKRWSQ